MKEQPFAAGFRPGPVPRLVGAHRIEADHSNRHARMAHMHPNEMEIFFVKSGTGYYTVDGHSYLIGAGDLVICNARTLHGEEPSQERRMHSYSIALTDVRIQGLPDGFLCAPEDDPVLSSGLLAASIGEMMELVYLLYAKNDRLDQVCNHTAHALLLLTFELLQSRARRDKLTNQVGDDQLARRIRNYIDVHYAEPLSLRTIAGALHINEYYLSHVFKDTFGQPPMQYLLKRRLGEAQTLLMDTDLPIAEIADQLGYGSPWNFSTAFRKHVGLSPSAYRQSFRTEEN